MRSQKLAGWAGCVAVKYIDKVLAGSSNTPYAIYGDYLDSTSKDDQSQRDLWRGGAGRS